MFCVSLSNLKVTDKLTETVEVSKALSETLAFNSSSENYDTTLKKDKAIVDRNVLIFKSKNN